MKPIARLPRPVARIGLFAALSAVPMQALATNIEVSITVDNSYALFYGTATAATTFVGADYDWTNTETYTFNLPANHYIYVVTASDLSTAQGFLGQFKNLDSNYTFYSNDPQWQVMATGLGNVGAPYSGSAFDLALLTTEINDANGGGNASQGWVATTAGNANGAGPWGLRPDISAQARWVWYMKAGFPGTNPTIGDYNHDEWLVFRVALAATPNNPVPGVPDAASSLSLLLAGLAGLGALARFRR